MTKQDIGRRIAAAREAANLTQEQLGERLGTSGQTVSGWEIGRTAPRKHGDYKKIADLTRTTVDWLLHGLDPAGNAASLPVPGEVGRIVPSVSPEDVAKYLKGDKRVVDGFVHTHFPCSSCAFRTFIRDAANWPDLEVGDSVIVDPEVRPRPDDFVLVLHRGMPMVRVFKDRNERVDLEPKNRSHSELKDIDAAAFDEMFLGTITEFSRQKRR